MKSLWVLLAFLLCLSWIIPGVHSSSFIDGAPHYRLAFIKREAQGTIGANEGETAKTLESNPPPPPATNLSAAINPDVKKPEVPKVTNATGTAIPIKATAVLPLTVATQNKSTVANATQVNSTVSELASTINLKNPGVYKRGIIVFGTFSLFALTYYIFYRKRNSNNESNSTSTGDNNQFRYGVLHSDDRRDNLELSRIPLTIESDEDDDEDLEVFDIEDRRKNMTYVTLQSRDLDIVNPHDDNKKNEGDNLLLDIDDGSPDTSMDWMQSSSKSIL